MDKPVWLHFFPEGFSFFRVNERRLTRKEAETYACPCPVCGAPSDYYCRRLNESKKPNHRVKNNISKLEPHPERRHEARKK